jgi:hypothetical protein
LIGKIKYSFTATVWRYSGINGWYFVSLPIEISSEIREHLKFQEEGWGRMKASAAIGNSQWDTAIWFDSKQKTYLLALKADVRKKENLEIDSLAEVTIWI